MTTGWLITNLVSALLLPPLNGLLLILAGGLLWRRNARLSRGLVWAGLLLLWVLAMPVVGRSMLRTLEPAPVTAAQLETAQAIVVLGGGRHRNAPEYGADTVSLETLARLRYAARLHRQTGLPLLVTGGKPDGGSLSEAEIMRSVLTSEFGVPVRWVETESIDTRQNALLSSHLLQTDGIHRVALVSHGWHLPRAVISFEAAGLSAIPAPTVLSHQPPTPVDYLPKQYIDSRQAIHEWLGLIWYRMRLP